MPSARWRWKKKLRISSGKPERRQHCVLPVRIVQLDLEPLTPTQLEEIFLYGLMSEEQREKFKKRPEMDTAMEVPGVIRFRVNIYRQRGAIGVVMRLIPLDIPTIDELGLPR